VVHFTWRQIPVIRIPADWMYAMLGIPEKGGFLIRQSEAAFHIGSL
jgi:hypothetical protein